MSNIRQLSADNLLSCKNSILESLYKYEKLLSTHPELLLNQILRGDLTVLNIADEVIVIGKRYLSGNKCVFITVFSYNIQETGFFSFRKMVKKHMLELNDYLKNILECETHELMCGSDAHAKMYMELLSSDKSKVKHEHCFKVIL